MSQRNITSIIQAHCSRCLQFTAPIEVSIKMVSIVKSDDYLLLSAQRSIFVYNTTDQTHSVTQVPIIPRKKHANDDEMNEKQADNDDEPNDDDKGSGECGEINRLAVSPCNRLVAATTTGDKFLFVYQFDNGTLTLLQHLPISRMSSAIRFTPDSKRLLVADKTGDCYILACEALTNQSNFEAKWILGHLSIVLDVLMTSDSKYIITSDRDEKIRVTNWPRTEVVESYCLGHLEFVPAIMELNESTLMSVSGDKTLRLWNYVEGKELFRLDLPARWIRLARNSQNGIAAILFENHYKIGIFELITTDNGLQVRLVAEHSLGENVKYISSILYTSDNTIWYSAVDANNEILLKQLEVVQAQDEIKINEIDLEHIRSNFKLTSTKLEACEDVTQLFKKSFDNLTEYHERKKRRIEQKHSKIYNIQFD